MTVPTETSYAELTWTQVESSFAPGIRVKSSDHLKVVFRAEDNDAESELDEDVHYGVSLDPDGVATLAPIALPAEDGTLLITRETPATQETDFGDLASYSATTHEDLHDRSAMRDAELKRRAGVLEGSALQLHRDDVADGADPMLPLLEAGRAVMVDDAGEGFRMGPTATEIENAQTHAVAAIAAAETAVDAAEEAVAAAALLVQHQYATFAALEAATIPPSADFVRVAGRLAAGDGGQALLKRVGGAPSHTGKAASNGGTVHWEVVPELGIWNATALGVRILDGSTYEAANTAALQAILATMAAGNGMELWLPAGVIQVNGRLDVPGFKTLHGAGNHGGTTLKSNALTDAVVQLASRSSRIEGIRIDATPARKAGLSNTGNGILITDGDVTPHVSQSRLGLDRVSVANQPRRGIRSMAPLTSSAWGSVETESNVGDGFFMDDGTGSGYANPITSNPGLLTILHYRGIGNGGPAITVGSFGQSVVPARVTIEQSDSFDNCWNFDFAPKLRPPTTLTANPIATTNGSNVIVVTQSAHPGHRGQFVKLAGCPDINGITAVQLNKVHQVKEWLSDTTFSIQLTAGSATSTASGGGAAVTAEHRVCANFFLSGESNTIFSNGVGAPFYDQTVDIFGATKLALQWPPGGMFFYAASSPKLFNNRYINTSYFWMADMEGTPVGDQATSLSQHINEDVPRAIQGTAPDAPYGFIVPAGCNAFINTGNQSAATTLIWNRDTASEYLIEGVRYRGVNDAASIWRMDQVQGISSATITAGGALVLFGSRCLVIGAGGVADNLDNLWTTGNLTPPAGFEVTIINDKAYTITIRHNQGGTGNIFTRSAANVSLTAKSSAKFVSDGTNMYEL